jgi:hypothetical protein
MTAEIGILNKSAVALAADSAVTISAGSNQEKIYDSADKLFELSYKDPVGIMVNGDMHFMQTPLAVLIKDYRENCPRVRRIVEVADSFLDYLAAFGEKAPESLKVMSIRSAVEPHLRTAMQRAMDQLVNRIVHDEVDGEEFTDRISRIKNQTLSEQLSVIQTALSKLPDASFVGKGKFKRTTRDNAVISAVIDEIFEDIDSQQKVTARKISYLALTKQGAGPTNTGVIVAGFGRDDLFPTLTAFQIYGVVGDRLKYATKETVDIDREGVRARVVPFAQREMVERFLYGLDDGIKRNITNFCKASVPKIREKILEKLEIDADDAATLKQDAIEAEKAFFDGLANDSFDAIREQSQAEIEDMVEFMPKPEMARMAEALVNLTSIKRRVSRGMETVGGPIDVVVISKAEGFVWVKRKHYFPGELNARYFDRMRLSRDRQEMPDGSDI